MQSIFSNALCRAVAKHIGLSATRRETLSWLALLIMQHGTIGLWRLAAYVASAARTASMQRRFYRFFQFVRLDGAHSARVVVELLGISGKPWILASPFALGLNTLRKIFAAASPDQIIAFPAQLLSPKLPLKPLLSLAFR